MVVEIIKNLYAKQWNNDYQLDLIGREYCRDRQLNCDQKEFAILMTWQQAKQQLIMAHTKWVETILEQLKVLKGGLRDHVYLEQSIDMAKENGFGQYLKLIFLQLHQKALWFQIQIY